MRLDLLTGEKQEWHAPLHTFCEELVIVSKKKGDQKKSKNAKEDEDAHEDNDDVWLLASMFNAKTNKACVGIFDGRDISRGQYLYSCPCYCSCSLAHALAHALPANLI